MGNLDEQDLRIEAIVGSLTEGSSDDQAIKFFQYLKQSLELPCEVTGSEDFSWEEYYVIGPGSVEEHNELRKTQPSYMDTFDLLEIEQDGFSEWMMFHDLDIVAHVRRKSDDKEFYLGLSELEVVDEQSRNYQLLHDYAVWLVNYHMG